MSAGELCFGPGRATIGTKNTLREDESSGGQAVFGFDQEAVRWRMRWGRLRTPAPRPAARSAGWRTHDCSPRTAGFRCSAWRRPRRVRPLGGSWWHRSSRSGSRWWFGSSGWRGAGSSLRGLFLVWVFVSCALDRTKATQFAQIHGGSWSRAGMAVQEGDSSVVFNGQTVLPVQEEPVSIVRHAPVGAEDVLLLQSGSGTACPALFQVPAVSN